MAHALDLALNRLKSEDPYELKANWAMGWDPLKKKKSESFLAFESGTSIYPMGSFSYGNSPDLELLELSGDVL